MGRRLGIPPSTIVYYKDRFSRFIPSAGGTGRRRRYPSESLELFRRIREMFENNWSVEQIEQELTACRGELFDAGKLEGAEAGSAADGGAIRIATLLAKMSDVLENQALFRGEIRSLRDEVASLRQERDVAEAHQREKVAELEREIERLRLLADGRNRNGALEFPPSEYLDLPLVIRTGLGEYLGVLGRNSRAFGLKDFVALLERSTDRGEAVDLRWRREGDAEWRLAVVAAVDSDDTRRIVLSTARTVTPSGNAVVRVLKLTINDQDAPDSLLLSLFRQIRESFEG
ncbi:MAG TPA: MerR family transcriptional regulator [Desulfovibrio sp.]|uniref:MerR family transcriptional regulator n=1 Tax=Desulfovibrio TaxID=872 RepID=UPI002A4B675F|nr:MerR family transcriptional regulator [Desulfovibrio sp.]MDY0305456.1 MerR family transcriptional regulator [Desulfovibrionaceae bacterium]HMM38451.1 MerR family transcriptional regulator [Desulfovibrio sp.]